MKDLKVIFMGTPNFSVPVLEALIEKCKVILVVTQPDRNFKNEVNYSPIKKLALKHNISVFQPDNISSQADAIIKLDIDIIITCAYGQIIPKNILDKPKYGCINVHASLLPKLRGGAPVHRAIINGNSKTGITIMYMAPKMDAGDIISQVETDILVDDNVGSLHDRLSLMGRDLLIDTLPDIIAGNINRIKQDESKVTYGWNIKREDERIDFDKSKKEIFNQIRGLNPWPGAYSVLDEKIIKIWESRLGERGTSKYYNGEIINLYDDGIGVKVSDGEIVFTIIQPEGKPKMSVKDFLNGIKNKDQIVGKIFK